MLKGDVELQLTSSTLSKQHSTLLPKTATMSNEFFVKFLFSTKSKQVEHVHFVSTLSKGRNFVRHCCKKTAPMSKQRSTLSKQYSTLSKETFDLPHSTMLLRHCCWCGRSFRLHQSCEYSTSHASIITPQSHQICATRVQNWENG